MTNLEHEWVFWSLSPRENYTNNYITEIALCSIYTRRAMVILFDKTACSYLHISQTDLSNLVIKYDSKNGLSQSSHTHPTSSRMAPWQHSKTFTYYYARKNKRNEHQHKLLLKDAENWYINATNMITVVFLSENNVEDMLISLLEWNWKNRLRTFNSGFVIRSSLKFINFRFAIVVI